MRRTRRPIAEWLIALFAGLVFAAGLVMSGMTQPDKIIGFLDVRQMFIGQFPGLWDASLALAMLGAVAVSLLAFFATPYASVRPWFTASFMLPQRNEISGRLVSGAVLFGIGWGLSGYCPGPALASVLTGRIEVAVFVLAMLPGMWLARKV